MSITIELATDLERKVRADADADGRDVSSFLAAIVAELYAGCDERNDDPALRTVVAEYEAEKAAGVVSAPMDEAFARIDQNLEARRKARENQP